MNGKCDLNFTPMKLGQEDSLPKHILWVLYIKVQARFGKEVRKFAKDKCCCQADRRTDGLYPMTAERGPNEKCQ